MEPHKTPLSHNFSEISFTCIFRCVTKQCTKSQIGCPQNAKRPKLGDLVVSSRGYACEAIKTWGRPNEVEKSACKNVLEQ